jgi:hypothetical protein
MIVPLSRRKMLQFLVVTGVGAGTPAAASSMEDECHSAHATWVAESLKRMLTVEPGMSRSELLGVFITEGGISTALQRTFVSRDCPFFKVDVTFHRANSPDTNMSRSELLRELDDDVIASISRPYLQFAIMD